MKRALSFICHMIAKQVVPGWCWCKPVEVSGWGTSKGDVTCYHQHQSVHSVLQRGRPSPTCLSGFVLCVTVSHLCNITKSALDTIIWSTLKLYTFRIWPFSVNVCLLYVGYKKYNISFHMFKRITVDKRGIIEIIFILPETSFLWNIGLWY